MSVGEELIVQLRLGRSKYMRVRLNAQGSVFTYSSFKIEQTLLW